MKTKTALLAIFLTFANLSLNADTASIIESELAQSASIETSSLNSDDLTAQNTADVQDSDSSDQSPADTKYVSEENESNKPKKDNSRLYNFLLALAAIAVATTAIILVSNNQGKHTNR